MIYNAIAHSRRFKQVMKIDSINCKCTASRHKDLILKRCGACFVNRSPSHGTATLQLSKQLPPWQRPPESDATASIDVAATSGFPCCPARRSKLCLSSGCVGRTHPSCTSAAQCSTGSVLSRCPTPIPFGTD